MRTKQTTKKTTGVKAERIQLQTHDLHEVSHHHRHPFLLVDDTYAEPTACASRSHEAQQVGCH